MAKEEKEYKDIYRTMLKERTPQGYRIEIERYDYEGIAGAIKKYEDLITEYEGKHTDKMLLVELQYISDGQFHTLKERHLWKDEDNERRMEIYNN